MRSNLRLLVFALPIAVVTSVGLCETSVEGSADLRPAAVSPDEESPEVRVVDAWIGEVLELDFDRALSVYRSIAERDADDVATPIADARAFEILATRGRSDAAEALRRRLRSQGLPIGPRVFATLSRVDTATRAIVPLAIQRAAETR